MTKKNERNTEKHRKKCERKLHTLVHKMKKRNDAKKYEIRNEGK